MLKRLFTPLVTVLYSILMLYVVIMGYKSPYFNWDMQGYIGSTIAFSENSPSIIYEKTKADLSANIPDWIFQQFMENPLSNSSAAFYQQLPFYKVKPLYNGVMWTMHQFGMSLSTATWAISVISFALLSLLIMQFRPRYMPYAFWLLSVLGLTFMLPWSMRSLAHFSTPDALSTMLGLAMLYAWLEKKSFAWFAVLAIMCELARPDAIVLTGLLTMYLGFLAPAEYRISKLKAVLLSAIFLVIYVILGKFSGNYGVERLFIYTFLNRSPFPAQMTDHLSLAMYWNVLKGCTLAYLSNPRTQMMIGWSILAYVLYCFKPTSAYSHFCFHLLLVTWATLIIRFLIHPAWGEDRYYFFYYIIILYTGGEIMFPYLRALGNVFLRIHKQVVQNKG